MASVFTLYSSLYSPARVVPINEPGYVTVASHESVRVVLKQLLRKCVHACVLIYTHASILYAYVGLHPQRWDAHFVSIKDK